MTFISIAMSLGLLAQAAEPASQAAASAKPAAAAPQSVRLVKGTVLEIELVDPLSSKTAQQGQTFAIRLVSPVVQNGVVIVPAGALGVGEVIDVGRSGTSGMPGKLVTSARDLELNGLKTPVRGLAMALSGRNRVKESEQAMAAVGLLSMLTPGGEVDLPPGTRGWARLAQDVDVTGATAALVPAAPGVTAATPTKSKIYFFRPKTRFARNYPYNVVEVGEDRRANGPLGELASDSFFSLEVEPGLHSFNLTGDIGSIRPDDRLRIDVDSDQTYYVEQVERASSFSGGFSLYPADQGRFAAWQASLKPDKKKKKSK